MEERLIALETRFSYQDHFLEQLNRIVTDQQKVIERLEKEIFDLKRAVNSGDGVQSGISLKDDKPPHY